MYDSSLSDAIRAIKTPVSQEDLSKIAELVDLVEWRLFSLEQEVVKLKRKE